MFCCWREVMRTCLLKLNTQWIYVYYCIEKISQFLCRSYNSILSYLSATHFTDRSMKILPDIKPVHGVHCSTAPSPAEADVEEVL